MKRLTNTAAAILLSIGVAPGAEQEPGQNYKHLKPLEWNIGQWTCTSQSANGDTIEYIATYEWGLNKNVLRYRIVSRTNGAPEFTVIGMAGWDAEKKQVVSYSFNSAGGRSESVSTFPDEHTVVDKGRWILPNGECRELTFIIKRVDENTMVSTQEGQPGLTFKRKR